MLTIILILTIFNTGLLFFVIGGLVVYKDELGKAMVVLNKHTDESIEALGTAMFNMDSLKAKASTQGKVEV